MTALLMVLKIIGIVVGSLAGLLILLLALACCYPVIYRGAGMKSSANLQGNLSASWLLRVLQAEVKYQDHAWKIVVKVFGHIIIPRQQGPSSKKNSADKQSVHTKKKDSAADQMVPSVKNTAADQQVSSVPNTAADQRVSSDKKPTADQQVPSDKKPAVDQQVPSAQNKAADHQVSSEKNNTDSNNKFPSENNMAANQQGSSEKRTTDIEQQQNPAPHDEILNPEETLDRNIDMQINKQPNSEIEESPDQKVDQPTTPEIKGSPDLRVDQPTDPESEGSPDLRVNQPTDPEIKESPDERVDQQTDPGIKESSEQRAGRQPDQRIPEHKSDKKSDEKNSSKSGQKAVESQNKDGREIWQKLKAGLSDRAALRQLLREVRRLWKHIRPTGVKGTVELGLDSPDQTAVLYGIAANAAAWVDEGILVIPDMEAKRLDFDLQIKGRLFAGFVVLLLLRLRRNDRIQNLLRNIWKEL